MRPRSSVPSRLWVTVAVAFGLVLGFLLRDTLVTRGSAQSTGGTGGGGSMPGRYQFIVKSGGQIDRVYVIDTQTGRCWAQDPTGGPWQDDSPPTTVAK